MRSYLVAAALAGLTAPAQAEKISLRADNWCPHNCEPGDRPGYMVEIAKLALEPAGHTIDYATLNWARAISESRNGAYSGIVGAATSDAEDFVFPSVAMGKAAQCFYTKKDGNWTYKSIEAIAPGAVGVIKDYSYGTAFDNYIAANAKDSKKIDIVSGDNPLDLNLKKLRAGRIVAFLEDRSVVKNHFYTTKTPEDVREAGCLEGAEDDLFVAFSPKTANAAAYAKLLADKVVAMRKDGSLKKLLEKYGLQDWEKTP